MPKKRCLVKRRTNETFQTHLIEIKAIKGLKNEIQGEVNQQLWLAKHTNRWMDDDLDALEPQTIQRLKKSSKEKENQTSTQTKLMKLSN